MLREYNELAKNHELQKEVLAYCLTENSEGPSAKTITSLTLKEKIKCMFRAMEHTSF